MSIRKWYNSVGVLVACMISIFAVAAVGLAVWVAWPRPDEIIMAAQRRLAGVKAVNLTLTVAWSGRRQVTHSDGTVAETNEALNFESQGWLDLAEPEQLKLSQNFSLRFGVEPPTLDFVGRLAGTASAVLVNFSQLPSRLGALNLAPNADRWLRFDLNRLRRNLDAPLIGAGREPTAEDRAYLLEQFRATPFLTFEGKLKDSQINGAPTHHYQVKPEPLFLKDFALQVEKRHLGRELTDQETMVFDTFFADLTPESGEIWIGRGDHYPYRARFRFRFDDGRRRGTLDLNFGLSEFNRPQVMSLPTGEIIDFTSIIESLLPGVRAYLPLAKTGGATRVAAGQSAPKGLPVEISAPGEKDSDSDGLPDALEMFYLTDPRNLDTDGDGVSDGDEVSQGRNPNGPGGLFDFGIPVNPANR